MQFAVRLIRRAMESALKRGEVLSVPKVVPQELASIHTGIYVGAYEKPGRKPRGRVGSYLPTKATLAEEIIHQTTRLLQIYPFTKEDLPHLTYELLLTQSPRLLAQLSDLRPEVGLLVRTSRGKHGVSLPVPHERTPDQRFSEACAQGDIDQAVDDTRLYTFPVERITEIT